MVGWEILWGEWGIGVQAYTRGSHFIVSDGREEQRSSRGWAHLLGVSLMGGVQLFLYGVCLSDGSGAVVGVMDLQECARLRRVMVCG